MNKVGVKRNLWILSAHFPPSNLASIHRGRLIANHMADQGWDVNVMAVHPAFYEEKLEPDLIKLVDPRVRIVHAKAFDQRIIRLMRWGDIGIRGWPFLYAALAREAENRRIDLLHITIPSNYQALIGRLLWEKFRIPYVIDYIDPWVHETDLEEPFLSKAWLSQKVARLCEPIAVCHASGIAGITDGYIAGVLRRNSEIKNVPRISCQYGASSKDHDVAIKSGTVVRRLSPSLREIQIVYAGALLPKAIEPLKAFLRALTRVNTTVRKNHPIKVVFIGTGSSPNDLSGYQILPIARSVKAEEWIQEYPERHPYLEVLSTLAQADGIVIIGSTESHYSPSKVFQSVLSKKPVLALLHHDSEARLILKDSNAGEVISFSSELEEEKVEEDCFKILSSWPPSKPPDVKWDVFQKFEAGENARRIAAFYEEVLAYSASNF